MQINDYPTDLIILIYLFKIIKTIPNMFERIREYNSMISINFINVLFYTELPLIYLILFMKN